jgi:hypothetical protein
MIANGKITPLVQAVTCCLLVFAAEYRVTSAAQMSPSTLAVDLGGSI